MGVTCRSNDVPSRKTALAYRPEKGVASRTETQKFVSGRSLWGRQNGSSVSGKQAMDWAYNLCLADEITCHEHPRPVERV